MFEGSYVALVTPFYPDGSVNFAKMKELCEWHIANGTDGLVVLGTTGENPTTEHDEDAALVRCVVDCVGGRVPVVAAAAGGVVEVVEHVVSGSVVCHVYPFKISAQRRNQIP